MTFQGLKNQKINFETFQDYSELMKTLYKLCVLVHLGTTMSVQSCDCCCKHPI